MTVVRTTHEILRGGLLAVIAIGIPHLWGTDEMDSGEKGGHNDDATDHNHYLKNLQAKVESATLAGTEIVAEV